MADAERQWPRWWALDEWVALLILTPAWALLIRVRHLRRRPVRLILTVALMLAVTAVWIVAFWPVGL